MTSYFIRRFLLIIPTFLGISLVVFFIMHFVPGGPVEQQILRFKMAIAQEGGAAAGGIVSQGLPADAVAELQRYYGFDRPVHIRYASWLWNVLHLDLGRSYVYQEPVWDVIKTRFPISIFLGLTGFFLSYVICIPLGVFKAVKHGGKFDFLSSFIVFLGYSMRYPRFLRISMDNHGLASTISSPCKQFMMDFALRAPGAYSSR